MPALPMLADGPAINDKTAATRAKPRLVNSIIVSDGQLGLIDK
jgi:hypothetical protein